MFFGLQVKSNQNQAKPTTLTNGIKLTQAVLEPNKNTKEPVCLMAEYDKKQFILCVLDPTKSWQSPLELLFEGGCEVKFFVRGSGTVHLTGYEDFDDLDDMSLSISEDEEVTSESDDEAATQTAETQKIKEKLKKLRESKTNGIKPKKTPSKTNNLNVLAQDDDDDDESDDEDYDILDTSNLDSFDDEGDDDDDEEDGDDDEDDNDEDEEMSDESIEIEEDSDEE